MMLRQCDVVKTMEVLVLEGRFFPAISIGMWPCGHPNEGLVFSLVGQF